MKTSTGLLILIAIMHFITLSNITLFDGRWNGIAMWLILDFLLQPLRFIFWEEQIAKAKFFKH